MFVTEERLPNFFFHKSDAVVGQLSQKKPNPERGPPGSSSTGRIHGRGPLLSTSGRCCSANAALQKILKLMFFFKFFVNVFSDPMIESVTLFLILK